jgi:hypothetical protein
VFESSAGHGVWLEPPVLSAQKFGNVVRNVAEGTCAISMSLVVVGERDVLDRLGNLVSNGCSSQAATQEPNAMIKVSVVVQFQSTE